MAKNRKHQAAEVRFGPVLKVLLLCSLICGSAIGYVWQKSQINHLGQQISEREATLKRLKKNNEVLAGQVSFLYSPPIIDRRAKELNLGLAPEQPTQVVRLPEAAPAPLPAPDAPRQFARRPAAGGTP
jgi:cell division protein FtsB